MKPELIVMLTHNDKTVANALDIFEECKYLPVKTWGFKDAGISTDMMKALAAAMHKTGKTVYIESLENLEEKCLESARIAISCGADLMSGGRYYDSVRDLLHENKIGYVPTIGNIIGRPAILAGTIPEMKEEAFAIAAKNVEGVDLASYRYDGDPNELMKAVVSSGLDVCIAGSIDSFERLAEITECGVKRYTIGSAFFNHKFGDTFSGQIKTVLNYMEKL